MVIQFVKKLKVLLELYIEIQLINIKTVGVARFDPLIMHTLNCALIQQHTK